MPRRWMMIPLFVSFLVGSLPAQDKKEPKEEDKKKAAAVKKDRQALQGAWQVVTYETGGEALPEETVKNLRVVFAGDQMTMSLPKDAGKREYTITLDPTQQPKTIDASPNLAKLKVKTTMPGIYQLDGDTLKLCLATLGGKVRPKDFESAAGANLITLKRAKK